MTIPQEPPTWPGKSAKIIPPKKLWTDPPGCVQLIRENAKTHPALGEYSTFPYYDRGDIWAKRRHYSCPIEYRPVAFFLSRIPYH